MGIGASEGAGRQALREMRAARRRRYAENVDFMEVLYRVYVVGIVGIWGLALLAGVVADTHVDAEAETRIAQDGPALLGLAIALALLMALRSGARGGPLAIQGADVQHVLLAPIDRARALRGPGLRQLRTAGFTGLVAGLIVANFAFRRLPGSAAEWLGCLALFGGAVAVLVLASAMLASGRRLRPGTAGVAGLVIVGWSLLDYLAGWTSSPLTMLGDLAILPMQGGVDAWRAVAGLGVTVAVVYAGLRSLGGLSLEAARRRATLAAELRFSVTVQDLRTVVLLRRQLAAERPRQSPWLRLGPKVFFPWPIWRRGWQSFLRWPTARGVRVGLIGVIAGLLVGAAWSGTTPLAALAGLALLVAGLDAVEPLAQEFDHPTRRDLLPIEAARLTRRHLLAPASLMAAVTLTAALTTLALGTPTPAIEVGALMFLPTAVLIVCCAALSATNDPYAFVFQPELGYAQTAAPIVLAIAGVGIPPVLAREAVLDGRSAAGVTAGVEAVVLIACAAAIWWLDDRVRKRVAAQP